MDISVNLKEKSYNICIKKGLINSLTDTFSPYTKIMCVTDDGIPAEYVNSVLSCAKRSGASVFLHIVGQGEQSKNFDNLQKIISDLIKNGFDRHGLIVALGGGVVGDLAGFASAVYMRGIDFINCPTSLLAMVDSSSGGKTAIDFCGVKNIVGSFYQPKAVFIDPSVLKTLDKRQIKCGIAEAVKMAACLDEELFIYFEKNNLNTLDFEYIIQKSCRLKKSIVEKDEKETGLRAVLNFGHTIGHGIEQASNGKYLHGECVAIGMTAISDGEIRERIVNVLKRYELPATADFDEKTAIETIMHDKKSVENSVKVITVQRIGSFKTEVLNKDGLYSKLMSVKEEDYE